MSSKHSKSHKSKNYSKIKDEEQSDDDDYGSEEEVKDSRSKKRLKHNREGDDPRDKKRRYKDVRRFVEEQAIEDSSEEEEGDEDEDPELRNKHHKLSRYDENFLKPKTKRLDDNFADGLAEKYKDSVRPDDQVDDDDDLSAELDEYDEMDKNGLLPSVNSPRLWQVRVKRGSEKLAAMCLMNKCIDYAKRGNPLSILSSTATENVEGFIYVEAFKEIHVREAIKGLSVILGGKITLISIQEMPGIYQINQKDIQLKKHQWIRIKSGLYNGDVGLVEDVGEDNKVWVILIPRLEFKKVDKSKKFSTQRPPQKIFNHENHQQLEKKQVNSLGARHFYEFKKQLFRRGFVYKQFSYKQIDADSRIKPSYDEAQTFLKHMMKMRDNECSSDEENNKLVEQLFKRTLLQGGSTEINKGDKVRVVAGDLQSVSGTVIAIEDGFIQMKPNIEGFDENIKINSDQVSKYFEPGDKVKVIDGKYKGETAIVVELDNAFAHVVFDQNHREMKILANYLKLKAEIDLPTMIQGKKIELYSANDLISYNNGKNAGMVLQVSEDYLKIINDQNEIKSIKLSEISKKFEKDRRMQGVDQNKNTIYADNVVKVINGKFKGRKGVIRYIFNQKILFLWDKEFAQTNGIFVEKTMNVVILGDEHIHNNQDGAGMNRRLKDKLEGKIVIITKGEFKGFRGLVKHCDDKQATVEISSQKIKKIHINKDLLQLWDQNQMDGQHEETNQGGQTVYDGGKTPMQYNTPSYYPHSPHWGTNQASVHGHDYDYNDGNMSPALSRPQTPRPYDKRTMKNEF